jgi:hypothetical protein
MRFTFEPGGAGDTRTAVHPERPRVLRLYRQATDQFTGRESPKSSLHGQEPTAQQPSELVGQTFKKPGGYFNTCKTNEDPDQEN